MPTKSGSVSNAGPKRAVLSLPHWHRHGTQPDYWSEAWRRKEVLADLDILSGNVFETSDIEELIARLEEAAAAADATKAH